MISYLNILIDLCLIFALWRLSRRGVRLVFPATEIREHYLSREERGLIEKAVRRGAIAEKFAERAFSMASSASLGVIALQKALLVPRPLTKPQATANRLAKKEVDSLFSNEGGWEFMKPYLDDNDLEVVERLEEEKRKAMNGNPKP